MVTVHLLSMLDTRVPTEHNLPVPRLTDEYRTYMKSERWLAFRARYFAAPGTRKSCRRCGTRRGIELHHLTYERLGHELLTDVTPLCDPCHKGAHRFHRDHPQLSLAEATMKYCGLKPSKRPPLKLLKGESLASERARRVQRR